MLRSGHDLASSEQGAARLETPQIHDVRSMILLRSLVFNVAFYLAFIALMVVGSPCLFLSQKGTLYVVRLWARVSLWLLATICGTKIEFRNISLRPKGAAILAIKHQSFLETFALITVLDDFCYILKKELIAIPFFGWWLKASGQIAIDRAKRGGTLAALQVAVRDKLAAGSQVLIFPEGTRRPVGAPPLYKVGVAALVGSSGVPCVPVALNSGVFWPRRTFVRRPGTIVIEFLPALAANLGKRDLMEAIEGAIEPATDALVAEALDRDPALARMVTADQARAAAQAPPGGEGPGTSTPNKTTRAKTA